MNINRYVMSRKTISRKDASELRGVKIKTIDRWIRRGSIEAFKPIGSSRVLIYEDSLSQENLQAPRPPFDNDL